MTTTIPDERRRELVRVHNRAKPAPFSTTPVSSRVPEAKRVCYFDNDADTFYWIDTADKIALRLHYDTLRANLHKSKSEHNSWLRGYAARYYVENGLARRRLEAIEAMEEEIANVRALLPATHAPGSVPKHEPSVYVELAERGLTNVEIATRVDPPVSEAAVRRGLAKAGYRRGTSSTKAVQRRGARRAADRAKA